MTTASHPDGLGAGAVAQLLVERLGHPDSRRDDPWPHRVVDGAVDGRLLDQLVAELAALPRSAFTWRRSPMEWKGTCRDFSTCGRAAVELWAVLNSTEVVAGLSRLTGVAGLVGDPTAVRAGLFATPPGGWQRVHEDFPQHPETGLWNRVALLVYLSDWSEGDGGELELWNPAMDRSRSLEPRRGRVVAFATGSLTRHGVRPVRATEGLRLAMAARYYSAQPPPTRPHPWYRRVIRRPGERLRDIRPSLEELRDYVRHEPLG